MSKSMDFFEKFFFKFPKLQFLRISRAMKFHETPTSIAIYVVSGFTFNASLFFLLVKFTNLDGSVHVPNEKILNT